jgi:AAA domain
MDAERALISKVVQTGKGLDVLDAAGVGPAHFTYTDGDGRRRLTECGEVLEFVQAHVAKYKRYPKVATVIEKFPDFDFEVSEEPLDYLLDRFLQAVERQAAATLAREIALDVAKLELDGGHLELAQGKLDAAKARIARRNVDADEAPEARPWEALRIIGTEPPSPPEICGLIYPGKRHVFSGEPEALKTWAALVACVEVIRAGGVVFFLDFGEGGRADVYDRLKVLGLSDRQILRFVYIEPQTPITVDGALEKLNEQITAWKPTLVIVDASAGALELHGLSENAGQDVQAFQRLVVAPLRAGGAAVVTIDHVTKNPDGRGKFAIGSQRKIGACDVHLVFATKRDFGIGRVGEANITTKKDRFGHLPRPFCGRLRLSSDAETGAVAYELRIAKPGEEEPFRPTTLMEKACTSDGRSRCRDAVDDTATAEGAERERGATTPPFVSRL